MIKRTLKNVRRLKWFTFTMWMIGNALILGWAKIAAEGWLDDKIPLFVVLTILLVSVTGFWIEGFMTYTDVEQEIEDEEREKVREGGEQ
jgi:hypothetical protein